MKPFEIPGGSTDSGDAAIAAITVPGAIVPNGVAMTPYSMGQIITVSGSDSTEKILHLITQHKIFIF